MSRPTNPQSNSPARPSVELVADAVVAAYIHEISARHRQPDDATETASVSKADDRA
jgi:hypothetical protein